MPAPPAPAAQAVTPPGEPSPWVAGAAAAAVPALIIAYKLLGLLALRRRPQSPVRQGILDVVAREPGIHHTDLVRRLGASNGTVAHHLRRLVADGALARMRTTGHTCYFPTSGVAPEVAAVKLAARAEATRLVLATLAQGPCSLSTLARRAGLPVSTAHYHVGKLERAGAVVSLRVQGRRRLALSEAGLRSLPAPQAPAGSLPTA